MALSGAFIRGDRDSVHVDPDTRRAKVACCSAAHGRSRDDEEGGGWSVHCAPRKRLDYPVPPSAGDRKLKNEPRIIWARKGGVGRRKEGRAEWIRDEQRAGKIVEKREASEDGNRKESRDCATSGEKESLQG